MTLLTERPASTDAAVPASPPVWFAPALGVGAAVLSFALLAVPVLVIRGFEAHAVGSWQAALGLAAATWLATLGAHVAVDGAVVSFVPLLLAVIPVALLAWSWRWFLVRRGEDEACAADLLPRNVLRALAAWWGGYAVVVAIAAGITTWGPARPSWLWLLVTLAVPPLLAAGLACAAVGRWDEDLLGARLDGSLVPSLIRRAVGPAVRGVGLLLLIGMVLLVGAVALRWDEVTAVQSAVGGGAGALVALGLLQVASVPNLALWVVSFLAGPGFSVVQGSSVTWSGSRTGLMPLIPVLAAHPQPASFPWWMTLVVILPVGVGAWIGRAALRSIARLSALHTKATVATAAAWMAAMMVCALDAVGGSSMGAYRLSDVGAPAGWLLLALGSELMIGALLHVLWDGWRLRR